MMLVTAVLLWVIAVPALMLGEETPQGMEKSYPPVPIRLSQQRQITSTVVGEQYDIYVGLPPGYTDEDMRYPVISSRGMSTARSTSVFQLRCLQMSEGHLLSLS